MVDRAPPGLQNLEASRMGSKRTCRPIYPVESDCPSRRSHQGDTCASEQPDC